MKPEESATEAKQIAGQSEPRRQCQEEIPGTKESNLRYNCNNGLIE
jgi:hypothetical protein